MGRRSAIARRIVRMEDTRFRSARAAAETCFSEHGSAPVTPPDRQRSCPDRAAERHPFPEPDVAAGTAAIPRNAGSSSRIGDNGIATIEKNAANHPGSRGSCKPPTCGRTIFVDRAHHPFERQPVRKRQRDLVGTGERFARPDRRVAAACLASDGHRAHRGNPVPRLADGPTASGPEETGRFPGREQGVPGTLPSRSRTAGHRGKSWPSARRSRPP